MSNVIIEQTVTAFDVDVPTESVTVCPFSIIPVGLQLENEVLVRTRL